MRRSVPLDELGALRALAAARAAEHKHHGTIRDQHLLRLGDLVKSLARRRKHIVRALGRIDLCDDAASTQNLDNWHRLIGERLETLLDGGGVVVGPARRLAALQEPPLHHFLRHVVEQRQRTTTLHLVNKRLQVVKITREAVDEVRSLCRLDRALEQVEGDLSRHDRPLLDHLINHLALLSALLHFLAQQVARRKVRRTVPLDELGALRTLAAARAAEHEHHGTIRDQHRRRTVGFVEFCNDDRVGVGKPLHAPQTC